MRSKERIKRYWYFDHQGIASLDFQSKEFRDAKRQGKGSIKGKQLGLQLALKAMGEIFGSARAKSFALYSTAGNHSVTDPVGKNARHLNKLLKYLTDRDALVLIERVDDFLKTEETALPLFCIARLKFLLDTKFYLESSMARSAPHGDKEGIIDLIIRNKFVVLRADLDESSTRRPRWKRITMGAGLVKWAFTHLNENGNPEFERSSDLAGLLRTSIDQPILRDFFGHVIKAGTSLYIKPFAIWD